MVDRASDSRVFESDHAVMSTCQWEAADLLSNCSTESDVEAGANNETTATAAVSWKFLFARNERSSDILLSQFKKNKKKTPS